MRSIRFALIALLIFSLPECAFAAISCTLQGAALNSATDGTSYTYASSTFANDTLYLLFMETSIASGTAPTLDTVTGGGLTWVSVTTLCYSTCVRRLTVFRALVSSGATTEALTLTLGGGTSTDGRGFVAACTGTDLTGTNGSGAVVQTATGTGTTTNCDVTLAAFGDSANRPIYGMGKRVSAATTPDSTPTAYTELSDITGNSPTYGGQLQYNSTDADTTITSTWVGSGNNGCIGAEIKVAGGAAAVMYPWWGNVW